MSGTEESGVRHEETAHAVPLTARTEEQEEDEGMMTTLELRRLLRAFPTGCATR
jgi:hypothetical protein